MIRVFILTSRVATVAWLRPVRGGRLPGIPGGGDEHAETERGAGKPQQAIQEGHECDCAHDRPSHHKGGELRRGSRPDDASRQPRETDVAHGVQQRRGQHQTGAEGDAHDRHEGEDGDDWQSDSDDGGRAGHQSRSGPQHGVPCVGGVWGE
jgi:hypothetical protein